jgi:hypothetical protein
MGVSLCGQVIVTPETGSLVREGPVLLTSLTAADFGGSGGLVSVSDGDLGAQLALAVPAGGTVVWCPREPVAMSGCWIGCVSGTLVVSYSYR